MSRTSPAPAPFSQFALSFAPLRQRRRFLDLSQKQLASAVGVHWHTISRLERGRTEPTLNLLVAIARALGTPLHQLFSVTDEPSAT
jgi:putative transcriptional regulator